MHHQRSEIDRRSVRVRLTEKGRKVRGQMHELFARHSEVIARRAVIGLEDIETVNSSLKRIERFWTEQIRYIY